MAVDWDYVIEGNRDALKRILAVLATMVAAGAAAFTSPLWGFEADLPIEPMARSSAEKAGEIAEQSGSRAIRPSSDGRVGVPASSPPSPDASRRTSDNAAASRPTLPRHLYRAVLRVLHPAESAARRLIVVASRGLVVPPPRLGPARQTPRHKPRPTAIVFPHGARFAPPPARAAPARIRLPLCDTLRPPSRRLRSAPASMAPRISVPGLTVPHRLPPKPAPDDPIDATRLNLRLAALAAALDDLPKEALRFARWRARRDARLGALLEGRTAATGRCPDGRRPAVFRTGRLSPLRPGRAPGWRRKGRREVHDVLANLQHFALEVLEEPDTS
jgi:hypothetical protein